MFVAAVSFLDEAFAGALRAVLPPGSNHAEVAAAGANPQFLEIEKRLDKIEKKIEFVDAEVAQRVGRKIGRDIGILYGLVAGLIVFVMLLFLYQKLMAMV